MILRTSHVNTTQNEDAATTLATSQAAVDNLDPFLASEKVVKFWSTQTYGKSTSSSNDAVSWYLFEWT